MIVYMLSILANVVTIVGIIGLIIAILEYRRDNQSVKEHEVKGEKLVELEIIESFNFSIEKAINPINFEGVAWEETVFGLDAVGMADLEEQLEDLKVQADRNNRNLVLLEILKTIVNRSSFTFREIFEDSPDFLENLVMSLDKESRRILKTYKSESAICFREKCLAYRDEFIFNKLGDREFENPETYTQLNFQLLNTLIRDFKECITEKGN